MREPPPADMPPASEYLFWRDEILQVMYWMAGEGLGSAVSPATLRTFLGGDEPELLLVIERVAVDGFLEPAGPGTWMLTELGKDAGKRGFAMEFEGLTGQAHGECGPDCWCHQSAARAAQCATERLARTYGGQGG